MADRVPQSRNGCDKDNKNKSSGQPESGTGREGDEGETLKGDEGQQQPEKQPQRQNPSSSAQGGEDGVAGLFRHFNVGVVLAVKSLGVLEH